MKSGSCTAHLPFWVSLNFKKNYIFVFSRFFNFQSDILSSISRGAAFVSLALVLLYTDRSRVHSHRQRLAHSRLVGGASLCQVPSLLRDSIKPLKSAFLVGVHIIWPTASEGYDEFRSQTAWFSLVVSLVQVHHLYLT